jgi:predicted nucleotidyltransferase
LLSIFVKTLENMSRPSAARNGQVAKRRLGKFVKIATNKSLELANVFDSLRSVGNVVIFGGLVRDVTLFGSAQFRSDIDLVVDVEDRRALEIALRRHACSHTNFGGYRLKVDSWHVDVWPFRKTWAIAHGFVEATRLEDLVNTTFFNWDAAFFSLDTGKLTHRDDYLDALNNLYLDVVLPTNPNPVGMAQRALRLVKRTGATISPALVQFILDVYRSDELSMHARTSGEEIVSFLRALEYHRDLFPELPFTPAGKLFS